MSELHQFFADLQKVTPHDDGTITVSGIASTETRDSQGEVVLASAMKAAIPGYMKFGAVREMHQPKAAGTALGISVDEATKTTSFEALIVDPVAVTKVKKGVYKGFSIGGKVEKRKVDDHAVIEAIQLTEISLVDRPANPEACIGIWKAEGTEPITAPDAPALHQEATVPDEPKTGEGTAPAPDTPPITTEGEVVVKRGAKYSKSTATAIRGLRKAFAAFNNDASSCMKAFEDLMDEDDPNAEPDGDEEGGEAAGGHAEPDGDEGTASSESPNQQRPMKAQLAESLAKVQGLSDELQKRDERIASLEKEVAELKSRPAASPLEKAIAVSKADDATVKGEAIVDDANATPLDLIKKAQQMPRPTF